MRGWDRGGTPLRLFFDLSSSIRWHRHHDASALLSIDDRRDPCYVFGKLAFIVAMAARHISAIRNLYARVDARSIIRTG